jgi:hypothetical protein
LADVVAATKNRIFGKENSFAVRCQQSMMEYNFRFPISAFCFLLSAFEASPP